MRNSLFLLLLIFLTKANAQTATISFEIKDIDNQTLIPGKLVLLQDGEQYEHGIETTEDLACRGNTIYTRNGKGTFEITPGTYEIWFGRGMEYSVDIQTQTFKDSTYQLSANLKREYNPEGYVSGDMHLHTYTHSGHGDATVEERLISCVAEGLEWAVATDHNVVLDYTPFMQKLELQNYMATAAGNEVSTPIGHFNTYPLMRNSKPIDSKVKSGQELFERIRKDGLDHTVIQINHPRWIDPDYFNTKGLDPYFGVSKHPEFDWGFDAFEVLNENVGIGWIAASDNKYSVKDDWFNMMNHGRRITGLGNSDSHSVIAEIAGVPRNYIKSSTDNPTEIDNQELAVNVKHQNVVVASGIYPYLTIDETYQPGDELKMQNGKIKLQLKVQAASWIDCDEVQLIENGVVIKTFDVKSSNSVVRLDTSFYLRPKRDSWYLVIASGKRSMFPMVKTKEKPAIPRGFTNPIWVDADSDGAFTSLYDYAEVLVSAFDAQTFQNGLSDALQNDPSLITPVFYHLFEKKHSMAVPTAISLLDKVDTKQKLMLYRELSRLGTEDAFRVLQSEDRKDLLPLEEVVLNYFIKFPITASKIDKFKTKEATSLDEQLNWLEDELRYLYSGASKVEMRIANEPLDELDTFKVVQVPRSGMLPLGKLLRKVKSPNHAISMHAYARMDTVVTFYIKTNRPITVKNGRKIFADVRPNTTKSFNRKLVEIPVKKGKNYIGFKLNADHRSEVCIYPLNANKLLDPALEGMKVTKHLALNKKVNYIIENSPKYHGYEIALTDGYRGTKSYNTQLWQGWNGENAEFVIDLDSIQNVEQIKVGCLADQATWIFFPKSVSCSFSTDGENFSEPKTIAIDALSKLKDKRIRDVAFNFEPLETRFIKVVAKKIDRFPDWFSVKEGDAWIFIDEVVVE